RARRRRGPRRSPPRVGWAWEAWRARSCRLSLAGGVVDGGADALIGPAAADVAAHRLVDVVVGRLRLGGQQRRGGHDLPGLAVAALRHVALDPGELDRVRPAQPLDGGDLHARRPAERRLAGADRLAVRMHGAGAALGDAAAVF